PGLILGLKSETLDAFISSLGKEIAKLEPSCMLHPNIYGNYEKGKQTAASQAGTSPIANFETEPQPYFAQQLVLTTEGKNFLENPKLHQEVFGPFSIVVQCEDALELTTILHQLEGQLTGTILGNQQEVGEHSNVVAALRSRVGRIIFNGVPTGVEVCPSMVHGGPFPASTDSRFTAVGPYAIKRWVRPVAYQSWPQDFLPDELKDENPRQILRLVNGVYTDAAI
ncbi:MAG: aldehyde dehydrogenase (NADP(+)), partial [Eudoraea sp.]